MAKRNSGVSHLWPGLSAKHPLAILIVSTSSWFRIYPPRHEAGGFPDCGGHCPGLVLMCSSAARHRIPLWEILPSMYGWWSPWTGPASSYGWTPSYGGPPASCFWTEGEGVWPAQPQTLPLHAESWGNETRTVRTRSLAAAASTAQQENHPVIRGQGPSNTPLLVTVPTTLGPAGSPSLVL